MLTCFGLIATLLGFSVAYRAIITFEPLFYHYVLTTLRLFSASYGFCQAFNAIRNRKIIIGNLTLVVVFTTAGLFSTTCGFRQAYRLVRMSTIEFTRLIPNILITFGFADALFGF